MAEQLDKTTGKVVGPRGAKGYKRWTPKEWLPIYEAIVALSCTGLSNEEVGKRFGYGKQQVSNILNTPQAKKMRELINDKLRKDNIAGLTDRLDRMQEAAMKHIEHVLDRPSEDFKNPLAIFDRSLAFLKSSGKLASDTPAATIGGNITNIRTAMILSTPAAEMLNEGLTKANQVKVIHGNSGNINP